MTSGNTALARIRVHAHSVDAVTSADFRDVLGRFVTGVTIVTGIGAAGPTGLTVGSFTSVSLLPPLVVFCAGARSVSWPEISPSGAFCVNILAAHQVELCKRFATSQTGKFADVQWSPAASGSPIIEGVAAWIDCEVDQTIAAGDHWLVIGRVGALGVGHAESPLAFYRGTLSPFARAAAPHD